MYPRKEAKDHGTRQLIEGNFRPGERVLVFTHGGIIRALVGSVIGLGPATRVLFDGPVNASVTHLRVGERGTAVVDYNLGGA